MNDDHSVTNWIRQIQEDGDSEAQLDLWNRFFTRLVNLARTNLRGSRRVENEEDVVVSAMKSFFARAERGEFSMLTDRSSLWPLLAKITVRKAANARRRQTAQKRGSGQLVDAASDDLQDWNQFISNEPTPEYGLELIEQCQRRLDSLTDPRLRNIAELKLMGYQNSEIATELGSSVRTVERRLNMIRTLWIEQASED